MYKTLSALLLAALFCAPVQPLPARASVTLLIPSQPNLEPAPQAGTEKTPPSGVGKVAPAASPAATSAPKAATPNAAEKAERLVTETIPAEENKKEQTP